MIILSLTVPFLTPRHSVAQAPEASHPSDGPKVLLSLDRNGAAQREFYSYSYFIWDAMVSIYMIHQHLSTSISYDESLSPSVNLV